MPREWPQSAYLALPRGAVGQDPPQSYAPLFGALLVGVILGTLSAGYFGRIGAFR